MLWLPAFAAGIFAVLPGSFFRQYSKVEPLPNTISATSDKNPDQRTHETSCPCDIGRPARSRSTFYVRGGAHVLGWPSSGGIYVIDRADGVELDFLELDRFSSTLPSGDVVEEDAHCVRMRKLGAKWWKSEWDYDLAQITLDPSLDWDEKIMLIGWPDTDSVWVLHTTTEDARKKGAGCLANARNMKERCKLLEDIGAVFYQDHRDCPELDF